MPLPPKPRTAKQLGLPRSLPIAGSPVRLSPKEPAQAKFRPPPRAGKRRRRLQLALEGGDFLAHQCVARGLVGEVFVLAADHDPAIARAAHIEILIGRLP